MKPNGKVIHIRDASDHPGHIYIGRPSPFGNPYPLGPKCDRHESIKLFRIYAQGRLKADPSFRTAVAHLRGKTLACFCAPQPCHGDVLLELAETLS